MFIWSGPTYKNGKEIDHNKIHGTVTLSEWEELAKENKELKAKIAKLEEPKMGTVVTNGYKNEGHIVTEKFELQDFGDHLNSVPNVTFNKPIDYKAEYDRLHMALKTQSDLYMNEIRLSKCRIEELELVVKTMAKLI